VEFGAWDGILLSNTYNLINKKSYKGVLIEGDKNKYKTLCKNIPQKEVIKICEFVTFDGDSTLDKILNKTKIPKNFDFLSIDIDGCDYYILESLNQFKPKIICIEFNPTIPNEVEFVQIKDFKVKQGSSPKSLTKLASQKGYSLVAVTHCNLIFVRKELKDFVIGSREYNLNDLRDDNECKTYLFVGMDATILSNKKNLPFPWHEINTELITFQKLPKILRKYRSDYGLAQKFLYFLFLLFNYPEALKNIIPREVKKIFFSNVKVKNQ
jgi:hypothetical protein